MRRGGGGGGGGGGGTGSMTKGGKMSKVPKGKHLDWIRAWNHNGMASTLKLLFHEKFH